MKTVGVFLLGFVICCVYSACPDDCSGSTELSYHNSMIINATPIGQRLAFCSAEVTGKYVSVRVKSMFAEDINFRFASETGSPPTQCPVQRLTSNADFQDVIVGNMDTYYQFYAETEDFYMAMAFDHYCSVTPCEQEIEIVGICAEMCSDSTICLDGSCVCPVGFCGSERCDAGNCLNGQECIDGYCLDEKEGNSTSTVDDPVSSVTSPYVLMGIGFSSVVAIMGSVIGVTRVIRKNKEKRKQYQKSMTL